MAFWLQIQNSLQGLETFQLRGRALPLPSGYRFRIPFRDWKQLNPECLFAMRTVTDLEFPSGTGNNASCEVQDSFGNIKLQIQNSLQGLETTASYSHRFSLLLLQIQNSLQGLETGCRVFIDSNISQLQIQNSLQGLETIRTCRALGPFKLSYRFRIPFRDWKPRTAFIISRGNTWLQIQNSLQGLETFI